MFLLSHDRQFGKMVAGTLSHCSTGIAFAVLLHPFGYAKALIQVGYEPLPPKITTSFFFGQEIYEYPNIFRYISHIRSVDGFFGLYKGVVPRVLAGTVGSIVQFSINNKIKPRKTINERKALHRDDDFVLWIQTFAKETSLDMLSHCCGLIASHPFHVIMMRSMVQFIGRETKYNSVYSSVVEIYNHDGVFGFFHGLVPRLIGEIITVWMTSLLAKTINRYLIEKRLFKEFNLTACNLVVSYFTHRFIIAANVMIVNNCGLVGGQVPFMPKYSSWVDCMNTLSREGELGRRSNTFFRVYTPHPTILSTVVKVAPRPKGFKHK